MIKEIKNHKNSTEFYAETKVKKHICPSCHAKTNLIHDYRMQKIQHLNFGRRPTFLVLKKRRTTLNCSPSSTDSNDFVEFTPKLLT